MTSTFFHGIFLLLVAALFVPKPAAAQHVTKAKTGASTETTTLRYSLITGAEVDQVAFSNWAAGGQSAIAASLTLNTSLMLLTPTWEMKHRLTIAYGRTKNGNQPSAVTVNQLFFESIYTLTLGWETNPFVSMDISTQVGPGYDYSQNPPIQISDFLDPAYLTQSMGLAYGVKKILNTRIGIGLNEVYARRFLSYAKALAQSAGTKALTIRTGIESVSSLHLRCGRRLVLNSNLRLFSAFDRLTVWDVRFDNTLTASVDKYVNVNLSVLTVYQKAISPKTQIREGLNLGIVCRMF